MLGRHKHPTKQLPARRDPGRGGRAAQSLIDWLLGVGIDGRGGFDSATQVARRALREHRDPEDAVASIVGSHRRIVAAGGFVTGLGGFVTLPAALPANVLEFYVVSTRMVAAIAFVRGYDVSDPSLRTAILLTLVEADSDVIMKRAGVASTGRLASLAATRLPPPARMMVNKAVGFRLLGEVGSKALSRLGRGVPLAGGVIGAGADVYLLQRIASGARRQFPPAQRTTVHRG